MQVADASRFPMCWLGFTGAMLVPGLSSSVVSSLWYSVVKVLPERPWIRLLILNGDTVSPRNNLQVVWCFRLSQYGAQECIACNGPAQQTSVCHSYFPKAPLSLAHNTCGFSSPLLGSSTPSLSSPLYWVSLTDHIWPLFSA